MNGSDVKTMRTRLQTAIDNAGMGGFKVTVGNGTYDPHASTGSFKVTFGAIDAETGIVGSPERTSFLGMATLYNLTPEDLDATFEYRGTGYRIVGLKTRRRKYPVSVERVRDNKGFKFPSHTVAQQKLTRKNDTKTTGTVVRLSDLGND